MDVRTGGRRGRVRARRAAAGVATVVAVAAAALVAAAAPAWGDTLGGGDADEAARRSALEMMVGAPLPDPVAARADALLHAFGDDARDDVAAALWRDFPGERTLDGGEFPAADDESPSHGDDGGLSAPDGGEEHPGDEGGDGAGGVEAQDDEEAGGGEFTVVSPGQAAARPSEDDDDGGLSAPEEAGAAARAADRGVRLPAGTTAGTPDAEGRYCPVAGDVNFINDWGFPRSGGRVHMGNDMFADEGTPIVAIDDARILRVNDQDTGLGGRSVTYELVDSGDRFYNAHLHEVADVAPGDEVAAGEVVGTVGRSGNARTTPPHNHIEWRPGGGERTNPYPLIRELCAGERTN